MIASKDSLEPKSSDYVMPNSRRVYVRASCIPISASRSGKSASHRRKISTASSSQTNRSASTTAAAHGAIRNSPRLNPRPSGLREEWIRERGDTADYQGREIKPEDNGYLTRGHEEFASRPSAAIASSISRGANAVRSAPAPAIPSRNSGMRARASSPPEMEFIAIRENHGRKSEGRRQTEERESEL